MNRYPEVRLTSARSRVPVHARFWREWAERASRTEGPCAFYCIDFMGVYVTKTQGPSRLPTIPLCSFVSFVVKVPGFPITAITRSTGSPDLFVALCLRPSASPPTPHSVLKTKAKPQFDRAVTERSK